MKLLVISDIHGIKTNLPLIKKKFKEFSCDSLIVLGDLYYNYGRTGQDDYDPEYVRKFLDSFSDKLVCMKGNCDENINTYLEPFDIIPGCINMKINKGQSVYVSGPNGSGKSTLFKIISGLLYPSKGTYTFNNEIINEKTMKNQVFSKKFHKEVGFVFQNPDSMRSIRKR